MHRSSVGEQNSNWVGLGVLTKHCLSGHWFNKSNLGTRLGQTPHRLDFPENEAQHLLLFFVGIFKY